MSGKSVQHMIKKSDAGTDLGFSAPSRESVIAISVSFVVRVMVAVLLIGIFLFKTDTDRICMCRQFFCLGKLDDIFVDIFECLS